jgi:predicted AAA+ superfamily ATPase
MIDVLARWNRWGEARLDPGVGRDLVPTLDPFLDTPEVVGLVGPRRAGKSTVLYQLMSRLEARGVPPAAMLHLNLEEPALAPELGAEMLERAYRTWRQQVFPSGRAFVFLDEVQAVPGWERWVRARSGTEDLKCFVTGSSSALLSRELGTLLTGRHLTFRVHPLGLREFLRFKNLPQPELPGASVASAALGHALHEYAQWGGFPEVVLAGDVRRKELLLKQYFDDVLYRDIALRHRVRDVPALRALAVHLLTHTASLVSYQRVAQVLQMSPEAVRSYALHLREAFLIDLLPVFSNKAAVRARNPQKVHAVDTGLRNAVCLSWSQDLGHVLESMVWAELDRRPHDGLFWWRDADRGEVDFVVRSGNEARLGVQVCAAGGGKPLPARELAALDAFAAAHPKARRLLVLDAADPAAETAAGVEVQPLWRWLLAQA